MNIRSEVEKIYEKIESVNRKIDIDDINIFYFNIIKRKLISMIRDSSQEYIEAIEVITMQDFKYVDLEYLKLLCSSENINMSYNISGNSAVIHASYNLTEAKERVKQKFDYLERKMIKNA